MGERTGLPGYPAPMSVPMSTVSQPVVPLRWQPSRVVAAVLCFVALSMAIAALFLPLYSGDLSIGVIGSSNASLHMTFTPWAVEYSEASLNGGPGGVPRVGYPMVFAVIFLACATAACWFAATPSAGRTASRVAGVVTSTAAAFLVGTAWTVAVLVMNAVDTIILYGTLGQGLTTDASYLVGYWLLLAATLLGFVAAVLSLLPARKPVWQSNRYPYGQPTPPYGLAGPRQHPAGPPHGFGPPSGAYPVPSAPVAYAIDPLSGRPLPGPPVVPHTSVDPLTGEPIQPAGYARPTMVDPLTGQPGLPHGVGAAPVDPLTGQPGQGAVDPLTGRPLPASVDPLTSPPSQPSGVLTPVPGAVDPLTGQPVAWVMPFSQDPVPPANGVAQVPSIDLPDAPPPPQNPPGPAIPGGEDPLAEPPRT